MQLDYGIPVRCYVAGNNSDGREYAYFCSDDGFVYRDLVGTSFDGDSIESWLRLPFNHFNSPEHTKTFKKAVLDVVSDGPASVQVTYEMGAGSVEVDAGSATDVPIYGAGGILGRVHLGRIHLGWADRQSAGSIARRDGNFAFDDVLRQQRDSSVVFHTKHRIPLHCPPTQKVAMSNDFFNYDGTTPPAHTRGLSSAIRAIYAAIMTAFDKMPDMTGNADELVVINSTATGLTSMSASSLILAATLPAQTGNAGKVITTDGSEASGQKPCLKCRTARPILGYRTLIAAARHLLPTH
ncbi:MAG: hypothetical protein IPN69_08475 [Acidobacteria bacterium]|nr:hypothetical protein [Acidobacteriota bacterium]